MFSAGIAFQSTRPVRGATFSEAAIVPTFGFQSTRPVRGATGRGRRDGRRDAISIHAPRAGRDSLHTSGSVHLYISIHAPRAGRDGNSTSPEPGELISIHAPRAGRDSRENG